MTEWDGMSSLVLQLSHILMYMYLYICICPFSSVCVCVCVYLCVFVSLLAELLPSSLDNTGKERFTDPVDVFEAAVHSQTNSPDRKLVWKE